MSCHVCGAPEAEPHFGGMSCRACAAFFRRYFHSKKAVISCTCQIRFQNSHPCRECRIQKCLDAGMTPEKVQHKREKHPQKPQKPQKEVEILDITSTSSSSSSASQSPPSLPLSPIPFQIIPRDNSNISHVVSKWVNVQGRRSQLYGRRLDEVTYYEMCLATKIDVEIMWSVIEVIFPQLHELPTWDKGALLRNFHPKWSLLVSSIDFDKNRAVYEGICTPEDYCQMVIKFWNSSMYENCEMEPKEILRIFEPFLRYYAFVLALPICEKKFNAVEYMAIALMIFFDGAHTNISSECADLCHNVKNIVLRELRGYYADRNVEEMRFIETIDVLQLMQKGESKFQEELLVCEMNNVHIHDDYRLMIREHNY
ncbi:hypothetical protein GCK72_019786 [Caenorhabditis remanei]|uniref:Uncharacterized protein n=1 Tax=Caenorhabditis remanei TaxID=31234 RepID=A0A6A5GDU0_CAERE|nr:hypothetical protein GCK72_019786 [Caenorhabditis remanei]KAF1753230.1 hypothetical protein GCK72_019786 [Caenorhabditis remanei]